MTMRELLKAVVENVSALKTQVQAALLIPMTDGAQLDESETTASDGMAFPGALQSNGESFRCVDDHYGYLTRNGLGSLDIGGAHDD